jgi:fibrillarin-like rRNA methylase
MAETVTYVKEINEGDSHTALTDAITNLLHVYDGDQVAVGEVEYECWKAARNHYHAEVAGEDGVVIRVIRAERC